VVAGLSDLIRRYGMVPADGTEWKPEAGEALSLDDFYG
jgi:hypothetical protein